MSRQPHYHLMREVTLREYVGFMPVDDRGKDGSTPLYVAVFKLKKLHWSCGCSTKRARISTLSRREGRPLSTGRLLWTFSTPCKTVARTLLSKIAMELPRS